MTKQYIYKAIVKRVIDGDTIVVDIDLGFNQWMHNQHVRLIGINTPEVRTKDLKEKKRGLDAKKFVEKFMPEGSKVFIDSREFKDKSGKYGRILGDIVCDNPDWGWTSIIHMLEEAGHTK